MPLIEEFRLVSYLSKWEHVARYPLSSSYPESLTGADLVALASEEDRRAVLHAPLDYLPIRGSERLRRSIATTYTTVTADDVMVFAGADEAIQAGFQALLEPAHHAVVVVPAYQSLESVPAAIGSVSTVPLDAGRNWSLDPDRLARAIRPDTRVIVINAPHNPTGSVPSREIFEAVVKLCRKHGLWLFSDEVYRGLEYDPADRLPQAADSYERGVSVNVMSKAYGLPGLRVGWLATKDAGLLARAERAKQYLSICNGGPNETLAAIALDGRDTLLQSIMTRARRQLARLDAVMSAHPGLFDWRPPQAGVLAFPRYKGNDGTDAFAARLVAATGILLVPSTVYRTRAADVPGDHLRIGFGRERAIEALDILDAWLAKNVRG